VQPHTSSTLFHDLPADAAGQRRAPARRVVPDAEAAMRRLAGFGMAVLVALSLVGLGFDVAMARLGVETVAAAEAPAPSGARGPGPERVAARPEHAVARSEPAPSMHAPIAPVVSASSRALRVPRPRPVM